MAGPDSYILENPQIAFQRAYMFGQQIAAQQQAQQQAQLKQQQALQAQQAMRMVYDNPTPENISRFYMAYPAYKEQFEAARKPLDEAAAADDLDFTARTLSLLSNGKNDDAISLMEQRASSFGNTRGMEKQAEAAKAIVQTAKTDPKAARQLFALKLAAANPKLYETVFGGAGMTSFQKDLAAAGIDPESPEGKAKAAEYVALKTDPIVEMDTPDGGRFVGRQSDYYARYGGGGQAPASQPMQQPAQPSARMSEAQYKEIEKVYGVEGAARYIRDNNIEVAGKGAKASQSFIATQAINGKTYYKMPNGKWYDNKEGR